MTRRKTEKFDQYKTYIPPEIHARIRQMAAAEGVTASRIGAQIIMSFFRGIPQGYGDQTEEALMAFHTLMKTRPPMKEVPESKRLSRVKIGDNSRFQGYPTTSGLSSRPVPEDNGPSLTDLQKARTSKRS